MKRMWIPLVATAIISGMLAFGLARPSPCRCAENPLAMLRQPAFLADELGATAAQRAELERLHGELARELAACCERYTEARLSLCATLRRDDSDSAKTEILLDEMAQAYAASERATLAHIRQVRAMLDEDRRARFDRLVARSLCRNCEACECREPQETWRNVTVHGGPIGG